MAPIKPSAEKSLFPPEQILMLVRKKGTKGNFHQEKMTQNSRENLPPLGCDSNSLNLKLCAIKFSVLINSWLQNMAKMLASTLYDKYPEGTLGWGYCNKLVFAVFSSYQLFILMRKMKYKWSVCFSLYYPRYLFIFSMHFQATSLSSKFTQQEIYYLVIFKSSEKFLEDLFENKCNAKGISPAIRQLWVV